MKLFPMLLAAIMSLGGAATAAAECSIPNEKVAAVGSGVIYWRYEMVTIVPLNEDKPQTITDIHEPGHTANMDRIYHRVTVIRLPVVDFQSPHQPVVVNLNNLHQL